MNADERFYIGYIQLSSSKALKYSEFNNLLASKILVFSKISSSIYGKIPKSCQWKYTQSICEINI